MTSPLFRTERLSVTFDSEGDGVAVVDDVSIAIQHGETVALVGESGCGKSVTALAALGLLDSPGRVTHGDVFLEDQSLLGLSPEGLRAIRGRRISMIFQEPMTSLNPVFTVGDQIAETLLTHGELTRAAAHEEAVRLLDQVGIPSPETRVSQYPHELSGGMKQRAMIAIALACKPDLLIADEPTTALDVTIQAQILMLLRSLQKELGMSILLITHNLGVVAQFARRVMVMYAGHIVEQADVLDLFQSPRHPYTQGLLASLPSPSQHRQDLASIEGNVPTPDQYAPGCRFCTRCAVVMQRCGVEKPPLVDDGNAHLTACWRTSS